MKKASLLIAAILLVLPLPVWAGALQDAAGGPEWLSYGGDVRIREENALYSPRGTTENSDYLYYRFRSRVWAKAAPVKELDAYARFTNEYRYYFRPLDFVHPLREEVILDNGYVGILKPAELPFSARLGRQDLVYGEGFLLFEGTPNDGSRTIYSDGGKVSLILDKGSLDILAFYNKGTQPFAIEEVKDFRQDDQEIGIYGAYLTQDKLILDQKLEAYYLYKTGKKSVLAASGAPKFPDNNIHILGARLSGDVVENVSYTGEFAAQLGDWGEEDQRAFGGYLNGSYQVPGCPLQSKLTLGYVYLSGDDPESSRHEGWDPILSRWPKYSEGDLLLYTFIPENGVGYWTNLQMLRAIWAMKPIEKMDFILGLNYLLAPENPFETVNPAYFAGGKSRGINPYACVKYQFTDWLKNHILVEYFQPGSYYQDDVQTQLFARWEFLITF